MSLMANPMEALLKYQHAVNAGAVDPNQIEGGYLKLSGEVPSGKKYDFVKILAGEVQALAIFGEEESYKGVPRYSVGYAVSENHRGRGLAVEAVNKGIEEFKKEFSRLKIKNFFVEAMIDKNNTPSIKVAKKLFPGDGVPKPDSETGTPALLFYKLITIP